MTKLQTMISKGTMGLATLATLVAMLPMPAHAALITQDLSFGMRNSQVTSLQEFLAGLVNIYPEGIISGYFGGLTRGAVVRYQQANGISAIGRVGPQTRASINAQMGGGGGGVIIIGGDDSAPIMFPEAVTTLNNSATISWNTAEAARSRVMYGTSWPFLYATAPSVSTTGFGSTANLTISGLASNTQYYYVRESIDSAGNIMWTTNKTFLTK